MESTDFLYQSFGVDFKSPGASSINRKSQAVRSFCRYRVVFELKIVTGGKSHFATDCRPSFFVVGYKRGSRSSVNIMLCNVTCVVASDSKLMPVGFVSWSGCINKVNPSGQHQLLT